MTGVEKRLTELLHAAPPMSGGVLFEDVARRVRRRQTVAWSVVGSAVTVAAVAVAVTLIGQSGGGPPSRPATRPSVDLAGAVPWIDAPAPPYQPPTVSPTAPAATDARACTADDVVASFEGGNGAGGHSISYVRFRNTSQSTCVLKGYPRVTATEPGRADVTATNGSFFPTGGTANMAPGQDTLLGLETDTYCPARPGGGGGGPPYHHIDIVLPGGGVIALDRPAGGFDVTCGLHLTKFFVQQPEQPQPRDPLTDLQVSLETPASVNAGSALIYVVDLANPTNQPTSLDPCPGYVEAATAPTPLVKATYALNCAPVPVIPAHRSIRFEMRLHVPANTPAGPLTIHWALSAPSAAGGSATVNVVATPTPARSAPSSPSPSVSHRALVPADAQYPAAGACARATGPLVEIDINPDVPAPRCVIVSRDEHLEVINTSDAFHQAGSTVTITWADYPPRSLPVDARTTFGQPFGEYLAPGVHDLHVSLHGSSRAEIWLR